MDRVEITGLSLGEVLAALYNNTDPRGWGLMQARASTPLSVEDAQKFINDMKRMSLPEDPPPDFVLWLDYVYGRPIKVGFTTDEAQDKTYIVRADLYDRDSNKPAKEIIAELRKTK